MAKLESKKEAECIYSMDEFAKVGMKKFHCHPECIIAAFQMAGKETATEKEAIKMIKEFMNKEVI